MNKIAIIGAGRFGTALGNSLLNNSTNKVCLFTRSGKDNLINSYGKSKYFPNTILNKDLTFSNDFNILTQYDLIFLAIPSFAIKEVSQKIKTKLNPNAIVVNLAKGLASQDETIVQYLEKEFNTHSINTLKGPTFASELINGSSSMFTFGYSSIESLNMLKKITKDTNIYLDYTFDKEGVEIYSLLKNIYAIYIGYIDAKYNSPNTRFLMLTKAFQEMKILGTSLGALEDTINLSCGFGDLGLTALNDLSRNRTLGLLIGKGFFTPSNNSVVIEGIKSIDLIFNKVSPYILNRLPLINLVKNIVSNEDQLEEIDFSKLLNQSETTVLTYGTFDLLHYGHLELLRRAHNYGTKLIVGLSTDEFNKIKGKQSVHSFEKRKELLESLSFVSTVFPEKDWNQKVNDIKKYNVDIFIMGDDWKGKFDNLSSYCKVEYLPRTDGISTTALKALI